MQQRNFKQVDVFTATAYRGNPLAVVLDGEGLSDERMQAFARWTNLSETSFVLAPTQPGADYRVRIFTPGGELPFAGHPTLGTCRAWLHDGGRPRGELIVQECGVGLVQVRRDGERLAFAAPALRRRDVEPALLQSVLAALGLPRERLRAAQWLDNGPQWLGLLVDDAQTVLALEPDQAALKSLAKVGVVAPRPAGSDTQFEVRAFAAPIGIAEDPVTGSLNAGLAQWLIETGVAPPSYVASQGRCLGRDGRVHVQSVGPTLWIGGDTALCVQGSVTL